MKCHKCAAELPDSEFSPVKRRYAARERSLWCRGCRNEYQRSYRKRELARHPDLVAARKRRARIRTYGLAPADYDRMVAAQRGACSICGAVPSRDLDIDHCHATGAVRGLLCNRCNKVLGQVRDDIELLRAMTAYLEGRK